MAFKHIIQKSILIIAVLIAVQCFIFTPGSRADSKTVILPITVNFPLLESLVVRQAYYDENQTADVVNLNDGCIRLTLSHPKYTSVVRYNRRLLRFETKISAKAGTTFFGLTSCLNALNWEGGLVMYQDPVIDKSNWKLSFRTIDTEVLDAEGNKADLADLFWNSYSENVYEYLNAVSVNLAPPVKEFKSFIMPVYPDELKDEADAFVESIRLYKVKTVEDAVVVEMKARGETTLENEYHLIRTDLNRDEINEVISSWEAFDTFVVKLMSILSGVSLTENERDLLLSILLDLRYEFVGALEENNVGRDIVREQFITLWTGLSPLLKHRLSSDPNASLFSYLGFFTASDALKAMDDIGPSLGIEISREGLVRLLQMLSVKDAYRLDYPKSMDGNLRELMGIDPILKKNEEQPLSRQNPEMLFNRLCLYFKQRITFAPPVFASENEEQQADAQSKTDSPNAGEYEKWLFTGTDLKSMAVYLNNIKNILKEKADANLKKTKIEKTKYELFEQIVYATAWQESCFRQFIKKKGKTIYMRSYDGSSVGLMQVNERVWRGFYDVEKLKWDISYNAAAGVDICERYLERYAIKRMKQKKLTVSDDVLARSVYAMYNGGPSHFYKFLKRHDLKKYYRHDILFNEKYNWVKAGDWMMLKKCLIGG